MCAARWHPKLLLALGCKCYTMPLTAAWGFSAAIYHYVKDRTGCHPNKLTLRFLGLKVQTPKRALGRATVVVLDKWVGNTQLCVAVSAPCLEEKSASVAVYFGGDQCHARETGRLSPHQKQALSRSPLSGGKHHIRSLIAVLQEQGPLLRRYIPSGRPPPLGRPL